jgi:hypothetical protein
VFIEGHHYVVDWRTGCWRWQLFKLRGYPRSGKGFAHRLMYEHMVGPIPEGHDLHHTRPHRDCINPEHVEPVEHWRHLAKHKRSLSKLTAAEVREIRRRAAEGESLTELASAYGLTEGNIGYIARGRLWKDVGGFVGRPVTFCQLPGCTAELTGKRHQKYCSPAHRQAAYMLRRAGGPPPQQTQPIATLF